MKNIFVKYILSAVIAATLVAGIIYMTFEASLIVGALDYSLYFLISTFAGVALLDEKEELFK